MSAFLGLWLPCVNVRSAKDVIFVYFVAANYNLSGVLAEWPFKILRTVRNLLLFVTVSFFLKFVNHVECSTSKLGVFTDFGPFSRKKRKKYGSIKASIELLLRQLYATHRKFLTRRRYDQL